MPEEAYPERMRPESEAEARGRVAVEKPHGPPVAVERRDRAVGGLALCYVPVPVYTPEERTCFSREGAGYSGHGGHEYARSKVRGGTRCFCW
jgi:hypothetical protein